MVTNKSWGTPALRLRFLIILGVTFGSTRMLIGAFSALFLLSRGLHVEDIAYLKAFQALVFFLLDIPLGYLADKRNKFISLILGVLAGSVWLGLTAYSPSVPWLYIGEGFNALSLAFFNGAFEAILVETYHKKTKSSNQLEKLFGIYAKFNFFFMALAVVVGGVFTNVYSPIIWWVACSVMLLLTALMILAFIIMDFKQNIGKNESSSESKKVTSTILLDIKKVTSYFVRKDQTQLLNLFLLSLTIGFFYQNIIQYWQPMISKVFPRIEYALFYSIIFFFILLGQSLAGRILEGGKNKYSFSKLNFSLLVSVLVITIASRLNSFLIVPAIILFFFIYRILALTTLSRINERISDGLRSTYLSLNSTVTRASLIIAAPIISFGVRIDLWLLGLIGLVILSTNIFIAFRLDKKGIE